MLASPYFVPGRAGLEALRRLRERDVEVRIFTNATATSDEPLVNVGYGRYRRQLLQIGVKLYEMAASRMQRDTRMRNLLGTSAGRLHANSASSTASCCSSAR